MAMKPTAAQRAKRAKITASENMMHATKQMHVRRAEKPRR